MARKKRPNSPTNGKATVARPSREVAPTEAPIWVPDDPRVLARLEVAAWVVVAAIAVGIRALNLNGSPLQPEEASLALASWNVLHRTAYDLGAAPLLVYANVVMIMALGASDAVVRALPMLAGVAVALVPVLLRRELGRIGALAAALVLALSPTLILASRTLEPTMPVVALGCGALLAVHVYQQSRQPLALALAAVLAALGLMTGPLGYDFAIVVLVYAAMTRLDERRRQPEIAGGAVDYLPDAGPAGLPWSDGAIRGALLAAGVAVLLAATGLMTNPEGLGVSLAAPLGAWAESLRPGSGAAAVFPAILVGYEPFALIGGVVGAVVAYRRRDVFALFLIWWAIVGFALLVLSDGSHPLWAAFVVVPLALLAGASIEALAARFAAPEARRRLAIFAPLALSLVATVMIAAGNASLPDPSVPRWAALAPPLAMLAYVSLFGVLFDGRAARDCAAAIGAVCLVGFSVHAATFLNPGGQLNPADLFHPAATSTDVRTMVSDVSLIVDELHVARMVQGLPVTETVEVQAPYADVVTWYLYQARFLQQVQVQSVNTVGDSPAVAIMSASDKAPRGSYAGEQFAYSATAPSPALDPVQLWRWLIYRESPAQSATYLKVYVKTQLGGGSMAIIERPVERPVERPIEPVVEAVAADGFWLRPIAAGIPISREAVAFIGLVLLAGLLRFWDLGSRMLHHDESLHAVYSYYLYIGKGYVHDPMMHGPFLFELNALVYFLLGATNATARVAPALFGTALVGMPYFFRDRLGRTGAVAASVLLTISPTILYYSRFIRHDIYQIGFMTVLVIATFAYLRSPRPLYLFVTAATVSLLFSDKEDTYFLLAILLSFLFIVNGRDVIDALVQGGKAASPPADVFILIGTLTLPMLSAAPYWFLQHAPETEIDAVFFTSFAILFGIGLAIGVRWNRRVWLLSCLIYWGIFVVLYTTFFSNPNGFVTGVFGALRYWIDQQGVARGGQPGYYYLVLLPLYEFLAVGVGLAGSVYWLRHRTLFTNFLMYWCLTSLVLWGWAAEKMPWMVVEMSLPFVLLSAVTLGKLIETTPWRAVYRGGGLILAVTLALAILLGATLLGMGSPLAAGTPIQAQQGIFQWVAMVVIFAGLVYAAATYWTRLGRNLSGRVAALSLVVLVFPFTIRTAWQAVYYHGDVPVEMLVYTQTAPDVGMVMNQIDDIAYRSGQGKSKLQVVYDSDVSWPFEWYLRDYTSRVFIGNGMPPANAPVVLAGVDNGRDQQVKQALGNNYVAQRYRLRWWFPEDTTYRNWTIPMIVQDLLNSTDRSALWRYLMYRETPSELGSTDFMLFVRRDLAYGPWAAPQATSQTADDTLYTQRQRVVPANQIIGTAGAANGQLSAPKGIAVAPSGEMYVADSGNNRIEEFGPNGQYVRAWGTKGTGNGQFNEPWDVAVGPQGDVYVADTWNHRIQEFTPTGGFVRSWGSNPVGQPQNGDGQFFGPRAIAFDAQGNVYVTDTGNKRIEKFDPQGRFLAAFGGPGADPGLFNEPVGLAIDQAGDVYVADTWNQRIQKLGPDFKPITSWPVAGWTDQSVLDKPYLALDPSGNVWVTDPSNNRVLEFGPNGQLLVSLGKVGNDQASFTFPTGVAVDAKGNLYVTDSQNNRIMVFGAIH